MKLKLIQSAVILTGALLGSFTASAQTIAQWTFETSIPLTGGPLTPEVGAGTATSNTGGAFTNPAGWGSTESWSSVGWAIGEYFQFQVSTIGFTDIGVNWQQTGSNSGPANFVLQYSTDNVSYTNFGTYAVTLDGWNTTATPAASVKSFGLSTILAINNVPNVYFRLTVVDTVSVNGGIVAAGGTSRVDNFTVTAIPEPSSTVALAGMFALAGVMLRRRRRESLNLQS